MLLALVVVVAPEERLIYADQDAVGGSDGGSGGAPLPFPPEPVVRETPISMSLAVVSPVGSGSPGALTQVPFSRLSYSLVLAANFLSFVEYGLVMPVRAHDASGGGGGEGAVACMRACV
jgi:hypothetical protein